MAIRLTSSLWVWNGSVWLGPYTQSGYTSTLEWITWTFSPPIRASQFKIVTTDSPSWIAWREIETYGN